MFCNSSRSLLCSLQPDADCSNPLTNLRIFRQGKGYPHIKRHFFVLISHSYFFFFVFQIQCFCFYHLFIFFLLQKKKKRIQKNKSNRKKTKRKKKTSNCEINRAVNTWPAEFHSCPQKCTAMPSKLSYNKS